MELTKLEKLKITPLSPSTLAPGGVEVLFNPNTYSISKTVSWTPPVITPGATPPNYRDLDAPPVVFGGGGARTLTLQLFFDVTELGQDADVRLETNKIVRLTRIERGQDRPPTCVIDWGMQPPADSDFPFHGVVSNLTQNFVLFRGNGQPVRANLTVVFTEYIDPEQNKRESDPDLTTYLVKRGDTLSGIATKLYRDPKLWRPIAAANGIDDARRLKIGVRLVIPSPT